MLRFALQNLVRNRARTALGLLGLAGATAGVVLLLSISLGARRMIADAMTMANGIIVMRKDSPNPVFSRIPTALEETLVATPGISAVVPEVWQAAYSIDGKPRIHAGLGNVSALLGVDPAKRAKMRGGGLFARTLVRGRLFRADEPDGLMISAKLAGQLKKEPGATVVAMNMSFTLTGIFDTGTPVFDNVLVAQEDRVRGIADMRSSSVSAFYCEVQSGANVEDVAEEIRKRVPTTVDAESTVSWGREVNSLVAELDPYLGAIALVAGTIGALGVVNTMLMSVRERVREIGVLRATGWHRGDVFFLVVVEASLMGAVGGGLGAVGGASLAAVASRMITIRPDASPGLVVASVVGAILLGAIGGLYPALYAARLDPIVALRGGA